jgi:hypothetical protein
LTLALTQETHACRIRHALLSTMSVQALKKRQDHEIQILKAIYALNNNDFKSINAAADFFEIPRCTLHRRRNGGSSQARSHKTVQFLTNAEEITLVR